MLGLGLVLLIFPSQLIRSEKRKKKLKVLDIVFLSKIIIKEPSNNTVF